jgi:hypothetical protein
MTVPMIREKDVARGATDQPSKSAPTVHVIFVADNAKYKTGRKLEVVTNFGAVNREKNV